jgi:hypothetical protein
MALGTKTKLMELRDAKIAQMLTDTDTAPTYATAIDLDGVTKITVTPKVETKKLPGDSVLKDIYQKVTEVELDIECSIFSLDVYKLAMGGTISETGTTPNQKTTYSLNENSASPGYFKIEGQWTYAGEGIGDAHVVIYKCKATEPPALEVSDASGDFGKMKIKAIGIPADSNGSWYDVVLNETKTDIT